MLSNIKRSEVIDLSIKDHTVRLPSTVVLYIGDVSGGTTLIAQLKNDSTSRTWTVSAGSIIEGNFLKIIKSGTTAASLIALTDEFPTSWVPDQEPGLMMWHEIDDPNINQVSGQVRYWPDRSGAGTNIATPSNGPVYFATGWRGVQPSMRFGPSSTLSISDGYLPVMKHLSGVNRGFTIAWTAKVWDLQALDNFFSFGHTTGTSHIGVSTSSPSSQVRLRRQNKTGSVLVTTPLFSALDTLEHIFIITYSGRALSVYVDNVKYISFISASLDPALLNTFFMAASYISGSGAQQGNFHTTAFLLWNHALNSTVLNYLYNYLANKYMS